MKKRKKKESPSTHLILQEELRLGGQLTGRRGIGLLEHGELLELLLQRVLLLLERRGQGLDFLGTQGAQGAVHQQLLADELGGQGGLGAARVVAGVLAARELAADPGARRRGAAARAAAAVALRDIRDLRGTRRGFCFFLAFSVGRCLGTSGF